MTTDPPLHEQPDIRDRRWFLLGIMCLSLVMVVMAVSGLNVAIPSIQRSLGATATDLQWIIDSYAIIFAGLLLSAGAIGDRFGRKRALQGGLFVFGAGSLLGTVVDSVEWVIAARTIMGIGAAFVMPATLSIVTAVFPPEERGKAIAVWAGFAGAGGALGPLVVGFLLTDWWVFPAYWWGAAFLVNVFLVIGVFTAVTIWSPRSRDDEATPLDPIGAVLSIVGLATLLYAIIEGPVKGWTSTEVLVAAVVSAITLVGFVRWELRAEHPMLPMSYFRNRHFSMGSGVVTFAFAVMFGFYFLAGPVEIEVPVVRSVARVRRALPLGCTCEGSEQRHRLRQVLLDRGLGAAAGSGRRRRRNDDGDEQCSGAQAARSGESVRHDRAFQEFHPCSATRDQDLTLLPSSSRDTRHMSVMSTSKGSHHRSMHPAGVRPP